MTAQDSGAVDVLVVTVTYNSADVILTLLESLPAGLAGRSWHLVVADNDSRDGTVALLRSQAPYAQIVEMGRNAGYAAGINAGIAAGPASTSVLVVNPDARLEPGSGAAMVRRLDDPAVGLVVPRLLDSQGRLVDTLRREPTVRRVLGDAVLRSDRAARYPAWGHRIAQAQCYEQDSTADWAAGTVMLLSRACVEVCGPWDESFFLYSEETEFCLRARNLGFRLVLASDAAVSHLGGESQVSPRLRSLLAVNRIRLYRRSHTRTATAAFWFAEVIREGSRAVLGRRTSVAVVRTLLSRRRMRSVVTDAATQKPDTVRRGKLARAAAWNRDVDAEGRPQG